MAQTSFVGETAALLADLKARLGLQGEGGVRLTRRGLAGTAVAVIHVLFVILLIASQWMPVEIPLIREQAPLTWVFLPQAGEVKKPTPPVPRKKEEESTAITTFVPPPTVLREEEENNAINLGLAIGRSLACGANSFEYLTSQRRAECLRTPWNFVYDRYGNIVLAGPDVRPVEPEKPRNSDLQARERYTTPQCPKNIDPNAPCLSAIVGAHP